jgi:hypothetical protein
MKLNLKSKKKLFNFVTFLDNPPMLEPEPTELEPEPQGVEA